MIFNKHYNLEGKHALFGASNYHWIRKSDDELIQYYINSQAKARGTELHDIASRLIKQRIKLPRSKKTLNLYVNDAIGYLMEPEQVLYFNDDFFGTTDAISFRDDLLRIHDLKTGTTPAHFEQLMIYAALFCLEYGVNPREIKFELRIYQNDEVLIFSPKADEKINGEGPSIVDICNRIVSGSNLMREQRALEGAE